MEELLIEKVREHECLYNTTCNNYRDQAIRNQAWEEIGIQMDMPASVARELWSKLRNCYLNAIKRRWKKYGDEAKKHPAWKYELQMSFLLPFIESKHTHASFELETPRKYDGYFSEDETADEHLATLVQDSEPSDKKTSSSVARKRSLQTQPAAELADVTKGNAEAKRARGDALASFDELDLFFLSMSRTVKKLPPMEQAKMKMEVCRLVTGAEVKNLGSHDNWEVANGGS